jgi:hypothetical protein
MRKIVKDVTELPKSENMIVIASYHKGTLLPRFKNTFMYLNKACFDSPVVLFLQDKKDVTLYSWVQEDIIFWCPEEPELTDLAKVRWFIQTRLTEHGVRILTLLDDDMRFARRNLPDEPTNYIQLNDSCCPSLNHKSTTGNSAHHFSDFMCSAKELLLREKRIVCVSMPSRFGSSGITKDQINKRAICVFVLDLQTLKEHNIVFDPFQVLMSDFEFDCAIAYAGLKTYCIAEYVRDGRENSKDPGGCNEYRTEKKELYETMTMRLCNRYPEVITHFFDNKNGYVSGGVIAPKMNWKILDVVSDKIWSNKHE